MTDATSSSQDQDSRRGTGTESVASRPASTRSGLMGVLIALGGLVAIAIGIVGAAAVVAARRTIVEGAVGTLA